MSVPNVCVCQIVPFLLLDRRKGDPIAILKCSLVYLKFLSFLHADGSVLYSPPSLCAWNTSLGTRAYIKSNLHAYGQSDQNGCLRKTPNSWEAHCLPINKCPQPRFRSHVWPLLLSNKCWLHCVVSITLVLDIIHIRKHPIRLAVVVA